MNKTITFLLLIFIAGFGNLNGQTTNILYGVTSSGGPDDLGVIFHIDPTTGIQTVDHSFPLINKGEGPNGDLVMGGNGKFYGMTYYGGENNMGVIFEWDPATNAFTNRIDFDGIAKGANPQGALSFHDGKFYGMAEGGLNGYGVIFEWDPSDNSFTKMIDFDGSDKGAYPLGTFTLFEGKFYGMTRNGGINNMGVIFKWDPANNIFIKEIDFNGSAFGESPTNGSLTIYDGKLYGMTSDGGVHGFGVIFEWDPLNTVFTKKIDFNGGQGNSPRGSLALSNGNFYGLTNRGGSFGDGVIFEWNPTTNTYTKKLDFDDSQSEGNNPEGSLKLNNGKFYGMTRRGGINYYGVIFEWDPITNIYTKKKDFEGNYNGSHPNGSLVFGNGKFYGMTNDSEQGFKTGNGTIFEWDPASNVFSKKLNFNHAVDGCNPYGSLIHFNGKLYGLATKGGGYDRGMLFEWDPANETLSRKVDFDGAVKGSYPKGSLTLYDGKFYGMTSKGGAGDYGVIFEWDPNNSSYIKKIDFDNSDKGSSPLGLLTLNGGKFYGMTNSGGTDFKGVIFEWDPVTNIFTKKLDFDGPEKGSNPEGSLAFSDGKGYGMTYNGGRTDSGILFEWDPATNIYTVKKDFDDNATGLYPKGSLTHKDGKFYGMTSNGGTYSNGIIFEWDPATNNFSKRIDFATSSTGWYPCGSLALNEGKFYGMTYMGGENDKGIIFGWDPGNNTFTQFLDFNGNNGSSPMYTEFTVFNVSMPFAIWTGMESNDWFDLGNWIPGIPLAGTVVTIPEVTTNYPSLTSQANCASIIIESEASFIGAEFLTVSSSTVKRDIANTRYHYLSSPVSGATFGNVFSGSSTTWAKKWNPLTGEWIWQTSLNPFAVGEGYAVTTSTPTVTANFVGTLNKTDITSSLSNANGGWNLLGNPFQSAVNWDDFIKDAGVSASVALWTGSNYLYWNGTVGFGGIIPAENGFFTSTTADGSTITIPLTSRLHANVPFYKENVLNALELRANGNNESDQMFVHFNNNATVAYDNQFDARKLFGEDYAPQLYSIISNDILAINELPMTGNDVVDVGFSCNADGAYSLTAAGMENFDASIRIQLEDVKMNITQDLSESPVYNFSYIAGENINRFKLHFKSTTGITEPTESGISVYSYDHNIIINNTPGLSGEVWVYDFSGRLMIHTGLSSNVRTSIPMQVSIGAYLVKVVTEKTGLNQKVFIR